MTESELLLSSLLQCDKAALFHRRDSVLDTAVSARVADALLRRIGGEPLQYIIGETEFMGLAFTVTPACLIPRPETEILVEAVLKYCGRPQAEGARVTILDAGTGSGCIAVSLAKLLESCHVTAVDISAGALAVARANARHHGVDDIIDFFRTDLFFLHLPPSTFGLYDIIVSNPPYIPSAEIEKLQIEVRREPRLALDGGSDGLDAYRALGALAPGMLNPSGIMLVEVGLGQARDVRNIFLNSKKFEIIETIRDYNSIERVIVARLS